MEATQEATWAADHGLDLHHYGPSALLLARSTTKATVKADSRAQATSSATAVFTQE